MTHLENISTEDLRQILAEVEGKDATQRMMAVINQKEEDGVRQKSIALLRSELIKPRRAKPL